MARVFDDGCAIPEKTLVTIGDHASLNAGSTIQAHSLEDGTFKSDADSFLMKGEDAPARARYRGNPAREAAVA